MRHEIFDPDSILTQGSEEGLRGKIPADIIIPDDKQTFVGGLVVGQQRPIEGPEQELLLQQKLHKLPLRDLHFFCGGSDIGAIRYLFEVIEAEVEKKSNCKSPGFDFYYSKAARKQEMKQPVVNSQKAVVIEERMENKRPPHRWTFEEDLLCCRRFFEQYVEQRSSMDLQFFAQQLHRELPEISVGSLRMKAQNIQQLCIEQGIRSSLAAKPLTQYSQQNRRAFLQVKKEFGL